MAKGGSNPSNQSQNHHSNSHGQGGGGGGGGGQNQSKASSISLSDAQIQEKALRSITDIRPTQELPKTLDSFESALSSRPEICFTTRLDIILPSFHRLAFSSQQSRSQQSAAVQIITFAYILHYPYASHQNHLQPFRQVIVKARNSIKSKSKDSDDVASVAFSLSTLLALEALLHGHEALTWLSKTSPLDLTCGRFAAAPASLLESVASLQSNLVREKLETLDAELQTSQGNSHSSHSALGRGRATAQLDLAEAGEGEKSGNTPPPRSPPPQPDVPQSPTIIGDSSKISSPLSSVVEVGSSSGKEKEKSSIPHSSSSRSNPITLNEDTSQVVGSSSEVIPSSSKPVSTAAAAIIAARSSGAKAAVVAGGARRARPRQKVKKAANDALSQSREVCNATRITSDSEAESDDSDGPSTCTCCHGEKFGPGFHGPESSMLMFQALTSRVREWFMDSLRRFPSHLDDIGVVVLEAEALEASGVTLNNPVWLDWSIRTATAMNEGSSSIKTELTTILNGIPDCPREKNSIKTDVTPSMPEGLFDVEAWNSLGSIKHFRPLMRALFSLFEMHQSKISSEFKDVKFGSKEETRSHAAPALGEATKSKVVRTEAFLEEMRKHEIAAKLFDDNKLPLAPRNEAKIKEIPNSTKTPRAPPPWSRRISNSSSKAMRAPHRGEEGEKGSKSSELVALVLEGTTRSLSMREQAELRSLDSSLPFGFLHGMIKPDQIRPLSERNPIVSHEVLACLGKDAVQADLLVYEKFKTGETNATGELIGLLACSSLNLVDYISPLASLPPSLRTFDLLTRLLGDKSETVLRSRPMEIPHEIDPEKRVPLAAPAARITLGGLTRTYCLPEFLSRQVDHIEKSKREGENVDKAIGLLCQFIGSLLTSGLLSLIQPCARAVVDAASSEKATSGALGPSKRTSETVETGGSKFDSDEEQRRRFFESARLSEREAREANEEEAIAVEIMLTELKHFSIRFTQRQDAAELFRKIVEREREEN